MIEVIYDGNLGNNLFQYCFGRILAERLGYKLVAKPIPGFPGTFQPINGLSFTDATPLVLRGQKPDLSFLNEKNPRYQILLTGYFQRYEYYRGYRDLIKNWLEMDVEDHDYNVTDADVVLGIRRGRDYIPRHGLPLSYFETALASMNHDRVFICTDVPSDPLVRCLNKRFKAIVIRPNPLYNLAFIKTFNRIIISNSTFLWWGAYLSEAQHIFYPRPKTGFWSSNDIISKNIALEVDEPEYKYFDCEVYKSEFFAERFSNTLDLSLKASRRILKALFPFLATKALPAGKYIFRDNDGDER